MVSYFRIALLSLIIKISFSNSLNENSLPGNKFIVESIEKLVENPQEINIFDFVETLKVCFI